MKRGVRVPPEGCSDASDSIREVQSDSDNVSSERRRGRFVLLSSDSDGDDEATLEGDHIQRDGGVDELAEPVRSRRLVLAS